MTDTLTERTSEALCGSCDSGQFRALMSRWPTGVTVVTTAAGQEPVGCTVNAMMSVSLAPALLVVALSTQSRTLEVIGGCGRFALNFLTAGQRHLCQRFATAALIDRFDGVAHRWEQGVPLLSDVATATVCEVREQIACGDHVMVVGEPIWHSTADADEPLVFYQKAYRDLVALEQADPGPGGAR